MLSRLRFPFANWHDRHFAISKKEMGNIGQMESVDISSNSVLVLPRRIDLCNDTSLKSIVQSSVIFGSAFWKCSAQKIGQEQSSFFVHLSITKVLLLNNDASFINWTHLVFTSSSFLSEGKFHGKGADLYDYTFFSVLLDRSPNGIIYNIVFTLIFFPRNTLGERRQANRSILLSLQRYDSTIS